MEGGLEERKMKVNVEIGRDGRGKTVKEGNKKKKT